MRSILLCILALPLGLFLTAAVPRAPGPGGVIEAHKQLFEALDRGDAEAAAGMLTRTSMGATLDASGQWSESPGAVFYLPGMETRKASPTAALAARFQGGKTRILRAWSDCASEDMSFAVLEFEHVPRKGPAQTFRSTSLVRHEDDGFRLYHWHVSTAAAAAAR